MARFRCSKTSLLLTFILSAIPLAFIISLEKSLPQTQHYSYQSNGYLRESAKYDTLHRRFLVALFEGGVAQIRVPDNHAPGTLLVEEKVIIESELLGNATLGVVIDGSRNRVLVVSADVKWNRYGAVAAYDLESFNRLFLTQLSGPGMGCEARGAEGLNKKVLRKRGVFHKRDEKSLADDVAVDADGNAYITDAKASKLWKVGVNGELLSIIRSPLFVHKQWYKNLVALNGIVYHPNGFLLVLHTISGTLYKVDTKSEEVKVVELVGGGSLAFGDGIELISMNELVVAGNPSGRLVESLDGWETAKVVAKYWGPAHRLASAVTVKDGKVYLNHMFGFGFGFPKWKHVIVEAVFMPVNV
ncbi:hypothetical protein GIB67_023085 [Kingdonia uniflora]|uniref:Uncharacterized protein n=1 Tax=Kingdonia uniflora TaxID=39325 RepID=A0A7J7L8K5_9MAGN|nr:hypothetical protein GIB67_023085 [Kingdonia uniflora]